MIKEGIHLNSIYQHWKGDYYLVKDVAFHHEHGGGFVVYSKCDINGLYISLRDHVEGVEVYINQPFLRFVNDFITHVRHPKTQEFVKRFKFIKNL